MEKHFPPCPITRVAELLSDTWTMLIMHHVIERPQRFGDLERLLDGISTRTLTLKLKRLVAEKMIRKTPTGAYIATEQGKGLRVVENAMKRYEKKYMC